MSETMGSFSDKTVTNTGLSLAQDLTQNVTLNPVTDS
jgi:hypothetical protein